MRSRSSRYTSSLALSASRLWMPLGRGLRVSPPAAAHQLAETAIGDHRNGSRDGRCQMPRARPAFRPRRRPMAGHLLQSRRSATGGDHRQPPGSGHDHCSLAATQAAALAVLSGQARPYHTQSGQPVSTGLGFLAQLYQVARARPPRPPRHEEAKGRTAAFETVQWSDDRSMEDGTRVDRYAVDSRRPRVTANELACALTALRT